MLLFGIFTRNYSRAVNRNILTTSPQLLKFKLFFLIESNQIIISKRLHPNQISYILIEKLVKLVSHTTESDTYLSFENN